MFRSVQDLFRGGLVYIGVLEKAEANLRLENAAVCIFNLRQRDLAGGEGGG